MESYESLRTQATIQFVEDLVEKRQMTTAGATNLIICCAAYTFQKACGMETPPEWSGRLEIFSELFDTIKEIDGSSDLETCTHIVQAAQALIAAASAPSY